MHHDIDWFESSVIHVHGVITNGSVPEYAVLRIHDNQTRMGNSHVLSDQKDTTVTDSSLHGNDGYLAKPPPLELKYTAMTQNTDTKRPENLLTQRFDLRPPIPNRPRFDRPDLCFCAEPSSDDEPPALEGSNIPPRPPPAAPPPIPADPDTPSPAPAPPGLAIPARGASGRPARSLARSVVAADSAAEREGFCSESPAVGSRARRCAACVRRARSWTDLNLSRSSVHLMVCGSSRFRRVPPPPPRSKVDDAGPVWAVLGG